MKYRNWVQVVLVAALGVGCLTGCWDSDPCDPDQVFRAGNCYLVAATAGAAGSTSVGAAGAAGEVEPAVTESTWRRACTTNDDCAGNSPICATAPLNYCTNINCSEGEANAAICPQGWTCFPASAGNPSACVMF
jgi:hypothetical protein